MLNKDLIKDSNMIAFPKETTKADMFNWFVTNAKFYGYIVYIMETSEAFNGINLVLKKILTNNYYECYVEASKCEYDEYKILSWILTPIKGGFTKECCM